MKNVVANIIQKLRFNKSKPRLSDILEKVKEAKDKQIEELTRDEKTEIINQIRKLYDPNYDSYLFKKDEKYDILMAHFLGITKIFNINDATLDDLNS